MPTRRARLRADLERDIRATALAHLRTHGADGLSLRAIARDLGMSAPGLYRYFASRDDLLTALIADSYDDLADHLLVATGAGPDELSDNGRPAPSVEERVTAGAPPMVRLATVARAYRAWARRRPNEFGLIYGQPIPGYAAPEQGVTVTANRRVAEALLRPLVDAWRAGQLRVPGSFADMPPVEGVDRLRRDVAEITGVEVDAALPPYLLSMWSRLHGIVSLEVFGQLAWVFADDAGALFDATIAALIEDCRVAA